ncbi:hypothetical protein BO70DRAFT_366534 [Aspergillus heteromorphus CBS 117.55]|uniref:Uncharacterized protein n=1 Tax=Aspergillus heteromorphus CBS 117.55 TaxID=1448321 RepID=A0A317V0X6_9EURO|nr:uncharacterized protein BO70DRAFT_366534 [Aspergillus heteromorphus CBS 117.55]PWY66467.1 hypothetical protein BO70DRAFT_366534 [Aspergillus heteromorphus CBS 117.55]
MHIKRERIITMCRHINITTTVITVRITDIVNVYSSINITGGISIAANIHASITAHVHPSVAI